MILSQALIVGANLCLLSSAEVRNKNSLDPATMVWVYDFLSLTGYGVTLPFLFTQYKMLTIFILSSQTASTQIEVKSKSNA